MVDEDGAHEIVTDPVPGETPKLIGAPGPAFGVADVVAIGPSILLTPSNGVTLK